LTTDGIDAPGAGVAAAAAPIETSEVSLRTKTIRGSVWTFAALGAQKAIQFGSSVALRWFLVPEVFGIMFLVHAVQRGLAMFSDFGIQPAVVQSPRGDDRRLLDTAWSLQVVRGGILCVVTALAAWPVARFYDEPVLVWLMLGMSVVPLVDGFTSTSVMSLQRHLEIRALRLFELATTVVGVIVSIAMAWVTRSIWALVAGAVASAGAKVAFSFFAFRDAQNRFAWHASAARELVHFGKWIFLATAVGFVSTNADGFYLGKVIDLTTLGVYTTAAAVALPVIDLVTSQTHGVLYPAFCKVARETPERLRSIYYRVRLRVDALTLPAVGALFVVAEWFIRVFYSAEYVEAGWMLRLLCVRTAMSIVLTPCETCLFSIGQTRFGLWRNLGRFVWIAVGLPLGFWLDGIHGIVWAVALSEIPVLLILWPAFRRHGLLDLRRELFAPLFFAAGALAGQLWLLLVGAIA
jgi:O-antigen/teichoic acid export membrane protein